MKYLKKSNTKKNTKLSKRRQKTRTRKKYSKTGGDIYSPQELFMQGVNVDDIEVVSDWLENGGQLIDVNATRPWDDYSPIMIAAENGNPRMAELLLRNDADVNASDDPTGTTALMIACLQLNVDIVRILLGFNADKSAINNHRQTALHILLAFEPRGVVRNNEGKRLQIIRLLSDPTMGTGGFDVDIEEEDGYTPLMTIVGTHQTSPYINEVEPIVDELISHGADITKINNHGTTAYDIAQRYDHNDSILEKLRPQIMNEQLNVPIPMMTPEQYENCEKQEGEVYDAITYEPLRIENAVKLEETNYCYDRENLRNWILRNSRAPTNPMTRSRISDAWIQTNYPRGIHNSYRISGGGKKRKTCKKYTKKRKTHKRYRK